MVSILAPPEGGAQRRGFSRRIDVRFQSSLRPKAERNATISVSPRCDGVSILAPPEGGAQQGTRQVFMSFHFFRIQTRTLVTEHVVNRFKFPMHDKSPDFRKSC